MKLLLLAPLVAAHYNFPSFQGSKEYQYVRMIKGRFSHGGVTDVMSPDMRCNVDPNWTTPTETAPVTAGSVVKFGVEPKVGHPGPLQFYMAKAPAGVDISKFDGSGPVWFKIGGDPPKVTEKGLVWPSTDATSVSVRIPASLPSGDYLLRVEHTALHGAGSEGGAQIYIACAQVKVAGGGNGNPGPKVAFPGAYKPADPGLKINLYWPIPTEYVMPGPPVWKG
ncbi:hypothetical protein EJ06DRAFT_559884 [Trichodelitschia bisporula]|uniref:lytic cellulose monooxygenase (C4-dehydrogenating) n=1 Tax=Trichodelitschia bisporula TaxID=703511 RepID=A0A6G1HJR6_9PEZI|nr:hypothetical protein EJ06DRAFT_559884 [Trichodelitschia bisporula]